MQKVFRYLCISAMAVILVPLMAVTVFADEQDDPIPESSEVGIQEEQGEIPVQEEEGDDPQGDSEIKSNLLEQSPLEILSWNSNSKHNQSFVVTIRGGNGYGGYTVESSSGCVATPIEADTFEISGFSPLKNYSVTFSKYGDIEYDPATLVTMTGRAQYGDGLNAVGNRYTYCDPDTGQVAFSQFVEVDGKRYYFDSQGFTTTKLGYGYVGSDRYYFNGDGSIARGFKTIDGKNYYFDQRTGRLVVSDFADIDGKRYYIGSEGTPVTNQGLGYVGADRYYFNGDGTVFRGFKILNGKTFYFDGSTGALVKSSFVEEGNRWYYIDGKGMPVTLKGYGYVGSDRYYFTGDGSIALGFQMINGHLYHFDWDSAQLTRSAFVEENDQRYYIGKDGKPTTHSGFGYVGANRYYFNGDGSVARGFRTVGSSRYHFNGATGQLTQSAFVNEGGQRYYIGKYGKPTTHSGYGYVGSTPYYFNGDGSVFRGFKNIGNSRYHFDSVTGQLTRSAFVNEGGQRYYIGKYGKPTTHSGYGYVGTDAYYFNGDGSVFRGLKDLGNSTYHFDEETGMLTRSAFFDVNGKRYFAGATGKLPTVHGFSYVGADRYYFNGDGSVRLGKQNIVGKDYYFNPVTGVLKNNNFIDLDGFTYYLDRFGELVTGKVYIGKYRYFFLNDGVLDSGLFVGKKLFYSDGTQEYADWVKRNGHIYYLNHQGTILDGQRTLNNDRYWFIHGVAQTGPQIINEIVYEFSQDGVFIPRAYNRIAEIAMSQLGHVGGYKYWDWYGWDFSVEWCACFVSWCADQGGYISRGVFPKYAYCPYGVNWFKNHGQWRGHGSEPRTGDIIFFQWDGDYEIGHTGIVIRYQDGVVYTMEGNTDHGNNYLSKCSFRSYLVDDPEIAGYGRPRY